MKSDAGFEALCRRNKLPWDFTAGYEPRWYNGPVPEQVKVLVLMAEPGAITLTEAHHLLPAITHGEWVGQYDLRLQERYWRSNLRQLFHYVWPTATEAEMYDHLGGTCAFWMSLPPGAQTKDIPAEVVTYFSEKYLRRLLSLFPSAIFLAAGGKAHRRLAKLGVAHQTCWAFTRPGCNQQGARDSWNDAGLAIKKRLSSHQLGGM